MGNGHEKRSQATRGAILDAAEEIFLDRGFDGGSLSAIAKGAGVSQSLISHHFGSKFGLWEATWKRLYERYFGDQLEELRHPRDDGADLLRNSIVRYFHHLKATPEAVRLQAWLFLAGQREPFPAAREVVELGFERLREGQRKGLIRKDIPAEFVWASFIGLTQHWFQLREEYGDLLQGSIDPGEDVDEAYLESLLKIFFGGVGGSR